MKRALVLLLALFLLFWGMLWFVFFSSSGLALVLRTAGYFMGETLSVENSAGSIAGGLKLSGLKVHSDSVDIAVEEVSVDWDWQLLFRRELHITLISVKALDVVMRASAQKQPAGAQPSFELPSFAIPLTLTVDRLTVDSGVVRQGERETPLFVLDRLDVQVEADERQLAVKELVLRSPEIDTTLNGKLTFGGDWPLEFQGEWQYRTDSYAPMAGNARLSGTVATTGFKVSLYDPFQIDLEGEITDIFNELSWRMRADVDRFNPRLLSADFPQLTVSAEAEAAGGLDSYSGRISATVDPGADLQPSFDLLFSGTQSSLHVGQSLVSVDGNEIAATAELDWSDHFSWSLVARTEDFELPAAASPVSGWVSMTVHADGDFSDGPGYHLDISDFSATLDGLNADVTGGLILDGNESGLTIASSGFLLADGHLEITGQLRWQDNFSWDVRALLRSLSPAVFETSVEGAVNAEISSSGGILEDDFWGSVELKDVSGMLAGYEVSGGGAIDYRDGNIVINSLLLENGANHLQVDGRVSETLELSFSLEASELNRLIPSLGGAVNARGTVAGSRDSPEASLLATAENLSYLDYSAQSLAADITISPEGDGIIDAVITAQGITAAEKELRQATVNMTGSTNQHRIEAEIDSDIGRIELSAAGEVSDGRFWDGSITTFRFEHPTFGMLRSNAVSSLELSMESVVLRDFCLDSEYVRFCAAGSWHDPLLWSLDLAGVEVDTALLEKWSLTDIACSGNVHGSASASGDGANLSSLSAQFVADELLLDDVEIPYYDEYKWHDSTVSINLDNGLLSTELSTHFVDGSVFKGNLTISEFKDFSVPPLDLALEGSLQAIVNDLSPLGILSDNYLRPSGQLTADFEISGTIGEPRFDGEINLADGAIHIPDLNVTAKQVNASFSLDKGLLRTELSTHFVDGSVFKGNIAISELKDFFSPPLDLALEGSLQAIVNDLSPLGTLSDDYLQPNGQLTADFEISGTIGEPRFDGEINLADGAIHIPDLNVTAEQINASLSTENGAVALTVEALSGRGTASAAGAFIFADDSWSGTLNITGKDVTLIDQKDVLIIADPDLLLELGPDGGRLSGTLAVPEALIQPEEMNGSVSESADVIIVEKEEASSWPFSMGLDIVLGEKVRVDGYGLSGRLMGSLDLADGRSGSLVGNGELYLVDGEFSFYDRKLEITRGRILFNGGPVDNPGLDVSARRTIKAEELEKDDIIVGVNIIGSVDDLEMALFSIPSMDEADIVAYIVVGTSISSADSSESGAVGAALSAITMKQGNKILGNIGGLFPVDDLKLEGSGTDGTSLVVGKRLMDDLYISYDFNLYKNAGFFRIRYDFGKGFSVESKNSIDSNRVNLLYSFER